MGGDDAEVVAGRAELEPALEVETRACQGVPKGVPGGTAAEAGRGRRVVARCGGGLRSW